MMHWKSADSPMSSGYMLDIHVTAGAIAHDTETRRAQDVAHDETWWAHDVNFLTNKLDLQTAEISSDKRCCGYRCYGADDAAVSYVIGQSSSKPHYY